MQRMRRQIMEHNVYRWAASVLGDLRELRIENQDAFSVTQAESMAWQGTDEPERKHA